MSKESKKDLKKSDRMLNMRIANILANDDGYEQLREIGKAKRQLKNKLRDAADSDDGIKKKVVQTDDKKTIRATWIDEENPKIEITVPPEEEKPEEEEWVFEEETITEEVVPILELMTQTYPFEIRGFAVYKTTTGRGPNEIVDQVGWSPRPICVSYRTNLDKNKDPLGLYGQETYRLGWCHEKFPPRIIEDSPDRRVSEQWEVEQLIRVDQSMFAYTADDSGGYTYLEYENNVWTWEGVSDPNTLFDWTKYIIDPGPPPPGICGYTWSPSHYCNAGNVGAYGKYGTEGTYHDNRHLFYMVAIGYAYNYWWPAEFNQYRQEVSNWYQNYCVYPNVTFDGQFVSDLMWPDWWDCSTPRESVPGGPYIQRLKKLFRIETEKKRMWGVIWGTVSFSCDDTPAGQGFPYIQVDDMERSVKDTFTGYLFTYPGVGIYVMEPNPQKRWWLQHAWRWDQDGWNGFGWGYTRTMRDAQDPNARFTGGAASLTSRQLTLCEGNEGAFPYVGPDYYTGLYYYDTYYYAEGQHLEMMIAGGKDFYIETSRGGYSYNVYGNPRYVEDVQSHGFTLDYGIFTKAGKYAVGDTVIPVYVYCYRTSDGAESEMNNARACFGIIYKDKLFQSEFHPYSYYEYKITVPNLTPRLRAGVMVYPGIRAGVLKKHTISWRRVKK